ncbi:hypothetical protein K2173_022856 [Erythroxylum novogranatense]|uniref:Kinesin light chain n=1 Tax=Erythroxylum novogranatense TaxID=1862640 RepID=A0AAV8SNZ0_9ROSI|nr:hypothetical protein K2173_022856 [Erythroxylum novogranatense]
MPGIVVDGISEEGTVDEINENSVVSKESSVSNRPPKSTLSPQSAHNGGHNVAVDEMADTSIEQLYENVCEMQSSDQSPSRNSFGSYGEESRVDTELRHLVGEEMKEIEKTQEEEEDQVNKPEDDARSYSSSKKGSSSGGKMSGRLDKVQSTSTKSVSSKTSNKASHCPPDAEASSKLSPKGKCPPKKPLNAKQNGKNVKRANAGVISTKKQRNSPSGGSKLQDGSEDLTESKLNNPDLGRYLLKQARDLISSGDNLQKALELAVRATESFELFSNGKPSLELVMSLHVTAAVYCSIGRYTEAIPVLQHSIEIPMIEEGQEHALAKFAGYMQLGDIHAMLGQLENSTRCYSTGLEVQKQALGDIDPRVGETCRYLAEAHFQALQFDEAKRLCQMALDIHKENASHASLEETVDRRLMGLICETMGDHEAALEHLVLASMAMAANGEEAEVASIDCSIGDTYLSLSRFDEAVFAYQKALTAFKSTKGENHPAIASVYIRLADLYNRTGKLRESKSYCENALRIYEKPTPEIPPEEIASGFADVSAIYESMNELDEAIKLLQKALKIYKDALGQQSTIAGIEAQMGVIYYMLMNYSESYNSFNNAISKLRSCGEKKSSFFGIALNQMGLTCVQRCAISEAAQLFEEAKSILEQECGPYHPDTLGVYSNLAATYDAMGRLDDAIELLEFIVRAREEKLGTANPDVDDEMRRLTELLKEAGRVQGRTGRSLQNLLGAQPDSINKDGVAVS